MNDTASDISGAFIAKLGAWLQLSQFIGFARTVPAMMKAFQELGTAPRRSRRAERHHR